MRFEIIISSLLSASRTGQFKTFDCFKWPCAKWSTFVRWIGCPFRFCVHLFNYDYICKNTKMSQSACVLKWQMDWCWLFSFVRFKSYFFFIKARRQWKTAWKWLRLILMWMGTVFELIWNCQPITAYMPINMMKHASLVYRAVHRQHRELLCFVYKPLNLFVHLHNTLWFLST